VKGEQVGPVGRPVTSLSAFLVKKEECNKDGSPQPFRRPANRQMDGMISAPENGKGCDIGYAPAISSCEGADSVDARTVAALDAITAFAIPNPNCSSQKQSVFSGLVALQVALPN
jgi:hypothetical protein